MALLRPVKTKRESSKPVRGQGPRGTFLQYAEPLPDAVYVPLFQRIQTHVVVGEEAKDDNGKYIQYIINVKYEHQGWQIARRFRTFEKLQAMLQAGPGRRVRLPDLPKTHMLWRGLDKDYVKSKAGKLDVYLKSILNIESCANSPDVYNFLFKARYTVGVRASFIGVPEEAKGLSVNSSQSIPMPDQHHAGRHPSSSPPVSQFDSPSHSLEREHGFGQVGSVTSTSDALEAALVSKVAPPGSALATYLEMNMAEIREHEERIQELRAEREMRIKGALKAHGGTMAAGSPGSPPLSPTLGASLDSVSSSVFDGSDLAQKHFGVSQDIDFSTYGTTTAAVAALNSGFILVTFPSKGTELSVRLDEPISKPSASTALSGTCIVNGTTASFEGSLMLAELKGSGVLKVG